MPETDIEGTDELTTIPNSLNVARRIVVIRLSLQRRSLLVNCTKLMTSREFIEKAPLYTRIPIRGFIPPPSIMRMCPDKDCKTITTWANVKSLRLRMDGTIPEIDVKTVAYECVNCQRNSLGVIYELLEWKIDGQGPSYSHYAVRKVGQTPAPSVTVPHELEARLGDSCGYYKNAIICYQAGFGIAAMAYLRRVVDDHTDTLIDVMAELMRTFPSPESEVQALLATKKEGQYKNKLEVASALIPEALKPGGVNPLGQIYKHTSIGLHNKSDGECIQIFDDLRDDFEYVFRNLHLQAEERRNFASRMQRRAGESTA
jgi:hypothetical protein